MSKDVKSRSRPITIQVAEGDPDDRLLFEDAFRENRLTNDLYFVENGEELLQYLCRQSSYTTPTDAPHPGLILLDLNIPYKDGREALIVIKAEPKLRHIPVVVLTTSQAEEDVQRSYELGVAGFITKPATFGRLVEIVKVLSHYWFEIVELPYGCNKLFRHSSGLSQLQR